MFYIKKAMSLAHMELLRKGYESYRKVITQQKIIWSKSTVEKLEEALKFVQYMYDVYLCDMHEVIDVVHRRHSGVFIFNFERISHLFLVFLSLTLNGKMFARKVIPKVINMSTNFQRCAKKAWKYLLPKYFCYIEVCTLVYKMFLKYFVGNVYFQESGCLHQKPIMKS